MKRSFYLIGILYFVLNIPISAQSHQNQNSGAMPGARRQALVVEVVSRVLEENQTVVWSETNRKVSIPGVPVGVQLMGSNVAVVVQFTPYIRRNSSVLVAQGQIWIADEKNEVTYYTSMQTIPMEYGEPIHFFPLGSAQHLNPSIEIVITVNPYSEANVLEETPVNINDGR